MVVFCLWYFLRYQDYSGPGQAFAVTLVKTVDLALLIYIANYLLVPRLLYKKKYVWFALALIGMIIVSSFIKMQTIAGITGNEEMRSLDASNLKSRVYDYVIPHFFLVIAGVAGKVIYDHTRMQRQLNELAKEKAEAELEFLKSQINPHFLFNSLNSVYFLIDKENAAARGALHKFSEMLRYQLYEANGSRIPIEKEVGYLEDYVGLQKLRKESNYIIELNTGTGVKGFSVEPLLLIPFVENAFKHISHHPNMNNFVRINLTKEGNKFRLCVINSTDNGEVSDTSGGIGLKNVKRRLELLYPGRHELGITEGDGVYEVNLSIEV